MCAGSVSQSGDQPSLWVSYAWRWKPESRIKEEKITFDEPSKIILNLSLIHRLSANVCGITKDSILVKAGVCEIFIPSAFSPSRDGHNDIFRVKYPFKVASFSLDVYNRWGQRVFETEDMGNGWDGTINGQDSPERTCVWFISFRSETGRSESLKGTVVLIR